MSEHITQNFKRGNVKGALISSDQSALDERKRTKMLFSKISTMEKKIENLEELVTKLYSIISQSSPGDP